MSQNNEMKEAWEALYKALDSVTTSQVEAMTKLAEASQGLSNFLQDFRYYAFKNNNLKIETQSKVKNELFRSKDNK